MQQFHKFILSWNSTCFGQFIRPSSGVYSLYTQQWYMSYRFVNSFRAGAYASSAPSWFYYKEVCYDARSHEHKITSSFCGISMRTSATNMRNYSRIRTSWLTMIMCQHTMLCHCRSFWPQRTQLWSLSLPTHMTKCWNDHIRTFPTTVESHTELWSMWQG